MLYVGLMIHISRGSILENIYFSVSYRFLKLKLIEKRNMSIGSLCNWLNKYITDFYAVIFL